MTTPVTDDIVAGAVIYLSAQPATLTAVDTFIIDGKQVLGIFQNTPLLVLEGTSGTCAVVSYNGGWAAPNPHNTLRFPRLSLQVLVDPERNSRNEPVKFGETRRRANAAYQALDGLLHRPQGESQWWGSIRTVTCTRLTEPVIGPLFEGDGLIELRAEYAVVQG